MNPLICRIKPAFLQILPPPPKLLPGQSVCVTPLFLACVAMQPKLSGHDVLNPVTSGWGSAPVWLGFQCVNAKQSLYVSDNMQ